MQRNNPEGRPQIHFRNQGFPPAKNSLSVLGRREEEGERREREGEGRRKEWGLPSRRGQLRLEGFFHFICALRACALHTYTQKMASCPPGGKWWLCQNHKKKKNGSKSNPITVKFQGGLICFQYQNTGALYTSLNKDIWGKSWERYCTRGSEGFVFCFLRDTCFTEISQAVAEIVF